MRFLAACFALSLVLASSIFGFASSGATAGVSAALTRHAAAKPLLVEVKKYKGKAVGKSWNKHYRKAYSGKGGNKYYVKRWNRRPHYGNVVAGVALGTIIGVAAAGVAPAPRGDLCWYWSDWNKRSGYWDYCY